MQRCEGVLLVGGAVRDLLLGAGEPDLDLVVEAETVGPFARALAERLGGEVREYPKYLTAKVQTGSQRLDVAATRAEIYQRPGALPRVRPADLLTDLGRRDFTVNTLAVRLGPSDWGALVDCFGGLGDLEKRRLRVLHERSFDDDPTRILRGVDLEARRGLRMDAATERLARTRLAAGALASLTGERLRRALFLLLRRPTAGRALARLAEIGLLRALEPRLTALPDELALADLGAIAGRLADAGLAPVPDPALAWLLALALDLHADALDALSRRLALGSRAAVVLSTGPPRMARVRRLEAEKAPPHRLAADLDRASPEELLMLAAIGLEETVTRYLSKHRPLELEISGRDLLALGYDPGPELGQALAQTLAARIDGKIGQDEELDYARSLLRTHENPPDATN